MTSWPNKWYLFIGVLVFLVMGYFGGWWDELFTRPSISQPSLKPAVPSMEMTGTQLTGWDGAKKTWDIEAQKIWQSADGNYTHFEKIIRGVAYSVKDKRIDFKAGWARWEKIPEQLYLGGGIYAKVEESEIETEDAVLNYRTEIMNFFHPIRLVKKDACATANKMWIDFSKEEMRLEGDVVLFQKKDQVTAEGIIFYNKDETYQFVNPKGVTIFP